MTKKINKIKLILLILLFQIVFIEFTLLPVNALLSKKGVKTVKTQIDKNTTLIEGSVIHGERALERIKLKADQKLTVHLYSSENNATFQIYHSKSRNYLTGTSDLDQATSWSGKISLSGEYVISIESSHGNAFYKLIIKIE